MIKITVAPELTTPETAATRRKAAYLALAVGVISLATSGLFEWNALLLDAKRGRVQVVFADAALKHPVQVVRLPSGKVAGGGQPTWQAVPALATGYTPVLRWVPVQTLPTAKGKKLYIAPGLGYAKGLASAVPDDRTFAYLGMLCAALFAAIGTYSLCLKPRRLVRLWLGLAGLRIASLCWQFGASGFFSIYANDEADYLAIAKVLIGRGGQPDYTYIHTLGLPTLYAPLLLLWTPGTAQTFAAVFGAISFIGFGTGSLAAVVWLLSRWHLPERLVRGAGIFIALYPWLTWQFHATIQGKTILYTLLARGIGAPPDSYLMSFKYFSDWVGYSALSDTPSLCFCLFALAVLGGTPRRLSTVAITGGLLGFAALIRLPAFFCLFPALYVLLTQRNLPRLQAVVILLGSFGVIAAAQAVWNLQLNGSPWLFGYQLAFPKESRGFEWEWLRSGAHTLGAMHYPLFAAGGYALLELSRSRSRFAAFLAIFTVPTLIFYAGCLFIGASPVRYILVPLTGLLLACGLLLSELGTRSRLLGGFICVSIISPFLLEPHRAEAIFQLDVASWLAPTLWLSMGGVALLVWRNWRLALMLGVLAVGRPEVATGFVVAAGGFACVVGMPAGLVLRLRSMNIKQKSS